MLRTDIVNMFISKYRYKKYLEIGLYQGENFKNIKCDLKHSVDPAPLAVELTTHIMTSDEFFVQISEDQKYDIVFIDGLHLEAQVDKDIQNSLNHLSEGGTIVMHDCNPTKEIYQLEKRQTRKWNGSTWKSFAKLRASRPDLEMYVVDTDFGCGVIRRGKQKLFELSEGGVDELRTYKFLDANREKLLNLISPEDFKQKLYQ